MIKFFIPLVLIVFVYTIFGQDVKYSLYVEDAKAFAENMGDFGSKFFKFSEEIKNRENMQATFKRTLLAFNNVEATYLAAKNLKDLVIVCAYAQRMKGDAKVNKDIISFSNRSMRSSLNDLKRRYRWANNEVQSDKKANINNGLTKLQKEYLSEYNKFSDFIDKIAEIVSATDSKSREDRATQAQKPKEIETSPKVTKKEPATIFIFTIPPNASVYMDGKFIGKANLNKLTVSPGKHMMRFLVTGKEVYQEMTFKPGDNGKRFVTIK